MTFASMPEPSAFNSEVWSTAFTLGRWNGEPSVSIQSFESKNRAPPGSVAMKLHPIGLANGVALLNRVVTDPRTPVDAAGGAYAMIYLLVVVAVASSKFLL